MEIKWEPNQCRLCFLSADDYINILEKTAHVTELLEQYFHDEVKAFKILLWNSMFIMFLKPKRSPKRIFCRKSFAMTAGTGSMSFESFHRR